MARKTPEILTDEQRAALGRIPEDLTDTEIGRYYTLSQDELQMAKAHRKPQDRLGIAVQLAVLHFPGLPWRDLEDIPERVLTYLAAQVGEAPTVLVDYAKRYQTGNEHLAKICAQFGYQAWDGTAMFHLTRELLPRAMESDHSLWLMQEALAILRRKRIVIPAITTVEAVVWNVQRIAEFRIERRLIGVLNADQRAALDQLVKSDPTLKGQTRFTWLRRPAKKPSTRSLKQAVLRIEWLRALNLPALPPNIPGQRLRVMARRCSRYKAQPLSELKNERRRQALLFCFLAYWQRELIDQSVDMFHQMWLDVRRLAKHRQDKLILNNASLLHRNLG